MNIADLRAMAQTECQESGQAVCKVFIDYNKKEAVVSVKAGKTVNRCALDLEKLNRHEYSQAEIRKFVFDSVWDAIGMERLREL